MKQYKGEPETFKLASKIVKEIYDLQSHIIHREILNGEAAGRISNAMLGATYQCLHSLVNSILIACGELKVACCSLDAHEKISREIVDLVVKNLEVGDPGHIYSVVILKRQRSLKD
jgi:hypothetical protein